MLFLVHTHIVYIYFLIYLFHQYIICLYSFSLDSLSFICSNTIPVAFPSRCGSHCSFCLSLRVSVIFCLFVFVFDFFKNQFPLFTFHSLNRVVSGWYREFLQKSQKKKKIVRIFRTFSSFSEFFQLFRMGPALILMLPSKFSRPKLPLCLLSLLFWTITGSNI